jgi:hypothetical protein
MKPRLVAWVVREVDLHRRVRAVVSRGVRLGEVLSGTRQKSDGTLLAWRLTDPDVRLADGLVPVFIDWGKSPHPSSSAPHAGTLISLRAEHPDPEQVQSLLAAVGVELSVTRGVIPALIARVRTARGEVELR